MIERNFRRKILEIFDKYFNTDEFETRVMSLMLVLRYSAMYLERYKKPIIYKSKEVGKIILRKALIEAIEEYVLIPAMGQKKAALN
jgi:hypothetical protein